MPIISGTNNSETIDGYDGVTDGDDWIFGLGGNDTIFGLGGDDVIIGDSGSDDIVGGFGADTLDGGAGIDTAFYFDSWVGVYVDLSTGHGYGGTAGGDELISIENLVGSPYRDYLYCDATNNTISGGSGNDIIRGGGGADTIDGGEGSDDASYEDSSEGVSVSLVTGQGSGGTAEGDELISIESLIGSAHNDFLEGNASDNGLVGRGDNDTLIGGGADTLYGGAGNDTLDGGSQHDELFGGTGADVLTGGANADYFSFHTADSGRFSAGQADVITDFADGERIYLQGSYIKGRSEARPEKAAARGCGEKGSRRRRIASLWLTAGRLRPTGARAGKRADCRP